VRLRPPDEAAGDNPPKNEKCAQCGKEIRLGHNGAIYCSRECRQRAYRVRKATAEGRNSHIPKRKRTKPTAREAAMAAALESLTREKEALAFANTAYALHLKAHPGEEKLAQSHKATLLPAPRAKETSANSLLRRAAGPGPASRRRDLDSATIRAGSSHRRSNSPAITARP
jgi:hypothetical protein